MKLKMPVDIHVSLRRRKGWYTCRVVGYGMGSDMKYGSLWAVDLGNIARDTEDPRAVLSGLSDAIRDRLATPR